MKATQQLHEMGQSLWLDNITRGLLMKGTLRRYLQEFSITGLTSNPTIFDHALRNSREYDHGIQQKLQEGKSGEALFFELAIDLPTTPLQRWPRRRISMLVPDGLTSSSRYPARRRAFPPLKRLSSRVCRST
jgi:hypothetical protein